ncbi:MAG TPA: hypothetical protein VIL49_16765 [Capillimicrobium sp.]|jgi:uncharacterized membrane protein YccC
MENTGSSSFLKRVLAVVVLAVAAWVLLKFVIGLITGVATLIVVVLAIMAVVWAVRTL